MQLTLGEEACYNILPKMSLIQAPASVQENLPLDVPVLENSCDASVMEEDTLCPQVNGLNNDMDNQSPSTLENEPKNTIEKESNGKTEEKCEKLVQLETEEINKEYIVTKEDEQVNANALEKSKYDIDDNCDSDIGKLENLEHRVNPSEVIFGTEPTEEISTQHETNDINIAEKCNGKTNNCENNAVTENSMTPLKDKKDYEIDETDDVKLEIDDDEDDVDNIELIFNENDATSSKSNFKIKECYIDKTGDVMNQEDTIISDISTEQNTEILLETGKEKISISNNDKSDESNSGVAPKTEFPVITEHMFDNFIKKTEIEGKLQIDADKTRSEDKEKCILSEDVAESAINIGADEIQNQSKEKSELSVGAMELDSIIEVADSKTFEKSDINLSESSVNIVTDIITEDKEKPTLEDAMEVDSNIKDISNIPEKMYVFESTLNIKADKIQNENADNPASPKDEIKLNSGIAVIYSKNPEQSGISSSEAHEADKIQNGGKDKPALLEDSMELDSSIEVANSKTLEKCDVNLNESILNTEGDKTQNESNENSTLSTDALELDTTTENANSKSHKKSDIKLSESTHNIEDDKIKDVGENNPPLIEDLNFEIGNSKTPEKSNINLSEATEKSNINFDSKLHEILTESTSANKSTISENLTNKEKISNECEASERASIRSMLANDMIIFSDEEDEPSDKIVITNDASNDKADQNKECVSLVDDDDDIMVIDDDSRSKNKSIKEDETNASNKTDVAVKENNGGSSESNRDLSTDISKKALQTDNLTKEDETGNVQKTESKTDTQPLVAADFLKNFKNKMSEMNRSDLEEFCLLKIVEGVIDRSNLSEIKAKLKTMMQNVEEWKKKAMVLNKQNRDLQIVLRTVQEEQKKKSDEVITPLKITRSVGMQVLMGETKPDHLNRVRTQKRAYPNNTPAVKVIQPKQPAKNAKNSIPVPRLVPATSPAKPTPIKPSPQLQNSTVTSNSGTSKIAQNNIVRTSPVTKVAEKRSFSDAIDLTDDEPNPPAKKAPVRLVPSQQLMAPGRSPIVTPPKNSNPRQVYIPIGSQGIRPGQTLVFKNGPQGVRPRGHMVPGMIRGGPAMAQRPSVRAQQKHPAPLPQSFSQPQPPNWKALPPAPDLKISKIENGIVVSWKIDGYQENSYEEIVSYQLYAYQETSAPASTVLWNKIGDIKALPLPMACTLTQFIAGYKYYFAVRAVDIKSRIGPFSLPGSILLLNK